MTSTKELHLKRKKMWDASMANHQRYLDNTTNLFGKKFVEDRPCPACAKDRAIVLFQKSGGVYVKCESCAMIFTNPAFTDAALEQYYSINHAVQSEIVASDVPFYRALYERGLNSIERLLRKRAGGASNPTILDVGCSAGGFLNIAREHGWSTFGLELNSTEREICAKSGHQVQGCTLENAKFSQKFSAVTLWDVFEHIKDGARFIQSAERILEPGGVLFVQRPSADSIAARILQEKCNMFDGLEHVNIYGRKQIAVLAERTGFEIVDFATVIPEVGVINNYLSYEDPYLGGTTDTQMIWKMISSDEVLEKGFGYKFQAILSKR